MSMLFVAGAYYSRGCSSPRFRSAFYSTSASRFLIKQWLSQASSLSSSSKISTNEFGPVTSVLNNKIESGVIKKDHVQLALAKELDDLYHSLIANDSPSMMNTIKTYQPEDFFDYNHLRSFKQLLVHNPINKSRVWLRYIHRKFFKFLYSSPFHPLAFRRAPPLPRGMYIHGSVGIGKSFCMDVFHDVYTTTTTNGNDPYYRRKSLRIHFHEFMLSIHERIHTLKSKYPKKDIIPYVAIELANEEFQLLCLDEFQITDIADAIIIKRLFEIFFDMGIIVLTTSNKPPEKLYEGGLNRSLFVPFITTIQENCKIISMDTQYDYRRDFVVSASNTANDTTTIHSNYFWPYNDDKTQQSLWNIFNGNTNEDTATTRPTNDYGYHQEETIPVRMGRTLNVLRVQRKDSTATTTAWFDFNELFFQPLGVADYLSIINHYNVIIIDKIPQLNSEKYNEARRFVTFIDTIYEFRHLNNIQLILSSKVALSDLFVEFDTQLETNDGDEEIAIEEQILLDDAGEETKKSQQMEAQQNKQQESIVVGEGGSSSSFSTTMIKNEKGDIIEWSSTGRVGVSLAQLSGVKDVAFSFRRAESRLIEMMNMKKT